MRGKKRNGFCDRGHIVTLETADVKIRGDKIYLDCSGCRRERERARGKDPRVVERRRLHGKMTYSRNITYRRDKNYFRKHGITREEKEKMFLSQGSHCANPGCRATDPGSWQGWHTDHIHGTKIIRGLLCQGCNISLGHLKDSIERILGLAEYLKKTMPLQGAQL